jgi:hypothetical protein
MIDVKPEGRRAFETYIETRDKAREVYEKAQDEYDNSLLQKADLDKVRTASKVLDDTESQAYLNLQDVSKVLAYILDCGYEIEVSIILEMLPCPLEDLEEEAEFRGWCSEWDYLRDAALKEGVLFRVEDTSYCTSFIADGLCVAARQI